MVNQLGGLRLFAPIGLLTLVFAFGCAKKSTFSTPPEHPRPYKIGRKWYQPLASSKDFKQKGIASWYGADFHGKKTANGETYDMHEVTAAHKTLPLDTYVKVDNLENGKSIVVRVNDRGPFVRGRIIDLSFAAAKKLGIVEKGTAKVKIKALGTPAKTAVNSNEPVKLIPANYDSGIFTFQVGAFEDRENAERLRQKLDRQYKNAHISPFDNGHDTLYRVRVGRYDTLEKIIEAEHILTEKGFKDIFIVAE
jgi:rare lipoprotein A